jgi:hypothetical protein
VTLRSVFVVNVAQCGSVDGRAQDGRPTESIPRLETVEQCLAHQRRRHAADLEQPIVEILSVNAAPRNCRASSRIFRISDIPMK